LGCDYLLLTILTEPGKKTATLCWREALTEEEVRTTSYVDLENRVIRFYDTKNRNDHELPICDATKRILEDRRDIVNDTEIRADKRKWVFRLVHHEARLDTILTVKACASISVRKLE
jgi:hypothetical protein